MEISLPYGRGNLPITLPDQNVAGIVRPKLPPAQDPKAIIKEALTNPIASATLAELITQHEPAQIVILTTDVSRPIPYQDLLSEILQQLIAGGAKPQQISFIIATGAHRPNTEQEIREVFGPLAEEYAITNHDCDHDLVNLGQLQNGTELWLNRQVAEADFLITTGCILPHNLAGYSGGPKLILPGVAGRKTIEQNHSLMMSQQIGPGKLQGNPVHQQMLEAARRVGVHFNINVLLNEGNQISHCLAGQLEQSWFKGCQVCYDSYHQPLPKPAEVVVAGAGGYPRDLNLYQAVKALLNGAKLTKPGGTVVMVGQCAEGMGEPLFKQWMQRAGTPEELVAIFKKRDFLLGAHKAYVLCKELKNKEVILLSDLAKSDQPVPLLKNVATWQEVEVMLLQRHGSDYRALILPFAGLVFPLSDQPMPSSP